MAKVYEGEVANSNLNEFPDKHGRGEIITTWSLGVMLNEDKGLRLSVGKNDPLFDEVQQLEPGDRIRVTVEPEIRMNGLIRHKLKSFELVRDVNVL